ncbi:serine/threonine-protein kinase [Actinokineospora iranica]|uniref:non-specific serine/threonine protein kinase n=1 Tax=Actinokineospora iranica TaxID=1271860 RepID=A0A1G6RYE5_9PSEU|nr:serine/threonine-protein kinase [Actinokineospora iranica]SDD09690.1 Serine/threonine protein kinase [Actinokineospora iranica]
MSDEDRVIAGRYRLISELGSGGMGVVWQAYDERLHRTVAVKQVRTPASLTGLQADEVNRVAMREGRIAAKLQHPNAITVYDVIEDDGLPYLVMEHLPSTSLAHVMTERTLSPAEAGRIGADLAAALAAAHEAGIVHRDIKPGNILLGDKGAVKITDFGISRLVEDVAGTMTNTVSGTPAYLAPEVAKGERATFPSDVFSLGATLYAAVEGIPPFGVDDNTMALLYRVSSGVITPPKRSGDLTDLLVRMLAADPAARPTMAEISDVLAGNRQLSALPAAAPTAVATPTAANPPTLTAPPAPPTPLFEPTPVVAEDEPREKDRTRPVLLVAAAVVVLGLVGGLLALTLSGDDGGPAAAATGPTTSEATPTPQATTTESAVPPPPVTTTTPSPPPSTTATVTSVTTVTSTVTTPPAPALSTPAPDTPAARQAAISDYYALVPGSLEQAWVRLTPKYQAHPSGGFGTYQRFWRDKRSVRVSEVTGGDGAFVEATVEYTFTSGSVSRERHRYGLVNQDGIWKIDSSTVLRG